jgi:hypothetical protein
MGISLKFDYLRGDNACDGNYMLRDLICVCWLEVTIELDQRRVLLHILNNYNQLIKNIVNSKRKQKSKILQKILIRGKN